MLIETRREEAAVEAGAPLFVVAGGLARGEYHCSECGYGIVTGRELPLCPMCGGQIWEPSSTSPFARPSR